MDASPQTGGLPDLLAAGDSEILAVLIGRLHDAVEFIKTHKFPVSSVSVSKYGQVHLYTFRDDVAGVDQLAAGIGVEGRWITPTNYIATLRFGDGPHIYEVVYIVKPDPEQAEDDSEAAVPAGELVTA